MTSRRGQLVFLKLVTSVREGQCVFGPVQDLSPAALDLDVTVLAPAERRITAVAERDKQART